MVAHTSHNSMILHDAEAYFLECSNTPAIPSKKPKPRGVGLSLVLDEPLEDVLLVGEVAGEDDGDAAAEVDEGGQLREGVLVRQLPVPDLHEPDAELVGLQNHTENITHSFTPIPAIITDKPILSGFCCLSN